MNLQALADRLDAARDQAVLTRLPSDEWPALSLAEAYAVAGRQRSAAIVRGARPVGYKIGFTNRGIWPVYGVHAPIWSTVWAHTATLLDGTEADVALDGLVQPRLEPEIVFRLASAPQPGMDEAELADCIDWVAHGFEIVHTHYAGWRFRAVDTVIDHGLHGRLLVGPPVPAARFANLGADLRALRLTLCREGEAVERADGTAVLGGPLDALRQWVDAMAQLTPQWPIGAGDLVTTGTLTDAWPIGPGQRWTTVLDDARLPGLSLRIA